MMLPNNKNIKPFTTEETHILILSIGKSVRWIADRSGISQRRLNYLLVGGRREGDKWIEMQISYPERYVLEMLSESAKLMELP